MDGNGSDSCKIIRTIQRRPQREIRYCRLNCQAYWRFWPPLGTGCSRNDGTNKIRLSWTFSRCFSLRSDSLGPSFYDNLGETSRRTIPIRYRRHCTVHNRSAQKHLPGRSRHSHRPRCFFPGTSLAKYCIYVCRRVLAHLPMDIAFAPIPLVQHTPIPLPSEA